MHRGLSENGISEDIAGTLNNLGINYYFMGQHSDAEDSYKEAVEDLDLSSVATGSYLTKIMLQTNYLW